MQCGYYPPNLLTRLTYSLKLTTSKIGIKINCARYFIKIRTFEAGLPKKNIRRPKDWHSSKLFIRTQ